MACLSHQNTTVRIAAMRATCSFILVGHLSPRHSVVPFANYGLCLGSHMLLCTITCAHVTLIPQDLDESSDRDKFQSTTGPMMECIMHSLNVGEEGSAQEALEMFIEVRYVFRLLSAASKLAC